MKTIIAGRAGAQTAYVNKQKARDSLKELASRPGQIWALLEGWLEYGLGVNPCPSERLRLGELRLDLPGDASSH